MNNAHVSKKDYLYNSDLLSCNETNSELLSCDIVVVYFVHTSIHVLRPKFPYYSCCKNAMKNAKVLIEANFYCRFKLYI